MKNFKNIPKRIIPSISEYVSFCEKYCSYISSNCVFIPVARKKGQRYNDIRRLKSLKLGNFIQPIANANLITTITKLLASTSWQFIVREFPRPSCSVFVHRDVSRLHYDTYRAYLYQEGTAGASKIAGNPAIRLQIWNRAKQWLGIGKWHGLEITTRIPNRWTKAWETRSSSNWGERMGDDSMAGELALVDPHADCHTTRSAFWNCNSRDTRWQSHLASIHELSSRSLSIFERTWWGIPVLINSPEPRSWGMRSLIVTILSTVLHQRFSRSVEFWWMNLERC